MLYSLIWFGIFIFISNDLDVDVVSNFNANRPRANSIQRRTSRLLFLRRESFSRKITFQFSVLHQLNIQFLRYFLLAQKNEAKIILYIECRFIANSSVQNSLQVFIHLFRHFRLQIIALNKLK